MNTSHQLPLHLQPSALHLHSIPPGLQSLESISPEANEAFFQQRYAHLHGGPGQHALHFQGHGLQQGQSPFPPFPGGAGYGRAFELSAPPQQHASVPGPPPQARAQVQASPISRPPPQIPDLEPRNDFVQSQAPVQIQTQDTEGTPVSNHGQFEGLRLIPNPPDLESWREKLFHVDDTITLTEDEYVWVFDCGFNVTCV